MALNPCKKIGGEYYGPSGKSINIDTRKSINVFLEYNKDSESLKEIEMPDLIKLYQAIVFVEQEYFDGISIKYPIKILINAIVQKCDIYGSIKVSFDGELKVESIMEAIRIFKNNIVCDLYDEALEDLYFKDNF